MLLLMAVYWCTETLPLAVTSLIPLVLAPMLSIQSADEVSKNYLKVRSIINGFARIGVMAFATKFIDSQRLSSKFIMPNSRVENCVLLRVGPVGRFRPAAYLRNHLTH